MSVQINFDTENALNSFLKDGKENVKLKMCSDFQKVYSGIPKDSLLNPILLKTVGVT